MEEGDDDDYDLPSSVEAESALVTEQAPSQGDIVTPTATSTTTPTRGAVVAGSLTQDSGFGSQDAPLENEVESEMETELVAQDTAVPAAQLLEPLLLTTLNDGGESLLFQGPERGSHIPQGEGGSLLSSGDSSLAEAHGEASPFPVSSDSHSPRATASPAPASVVQPSGHANGEPQVRRTIGFGNDKILPL